MNKMEINGSEYLTIQEVADLCEVDYMNIYMRLNKFTTWGISQHRFILKSEAEDYKKMLDLKKQFNERSKKDE